MSIENYNKKLVAILGFGVEGKATAKYLIKHGIKPVLFDQRPWDQWPKEEQNEIKSLELNFIFGPDSFKELAGFDVVFRSPGVKLSEIPKGKFEITSQTKFFFENCPCKIIGVTGTKGKGTTASLTYEILKTDGKTVFLTGNIGKVQPLEILENLKPTDWIVYELSSFQLQDLNLSPHISVVLMTTSEHLDYHKDLNEYVAAKASITKFQSVNDFAIISSDYENSVKIGSQGDAKKLFYSLKKVDNVNCFLKDENIIIKDSSFFYPTSNLQLLGQHNLENVCAAFLATQTAGCSYNSLEIAANNFKGLEHRMEFVVEKNGVKFYNDSFSTTPETAIAAIKSFSKPLILILGGSSKKSDFLELAQNIVNAKNIKSLVLIGQETERILSEISKAGEFKGKVLTGAKNMEEIFAQIKPNLTPGDVVLLSPACASYDMFKNYQDRGMQFKNKALNF